MTTKTDDLRDLIRDGDLERAIERTQSLAATVDVDARNLAISFSAKLVRLRRATISGTVTREENDVARQRLTLDLLSLLDDLDKRLERSDRQVPVVLFPSERQWNEKVFGVSHLRSLGWLRQGMERARAVCRITTPTSFGTGFVTRGGLLVTNHHVLPSAAVAAASQAEFGFEDDALKRATVPVPFQVDGATWRGHGDLDCVVVGVIGGPNAIRAWGELPLDESGCTKGDHVTIVQHPEGGPKQIALTANEVVNVFEHRLQYTTDTLPGSSGSPVFNDRWQVVALHHAGGNIVKNARGDRMYANEGILSGFVKRALGLS